eukprot:gene33572-40613_t
MVSDAVAEEKAYVLRIVYMLYLGEVQSMFSGTEIGSEVVPEDLDPAYPQEEDDAAEDDNEEDGGGFDDGFRTAEGSIESGATKASDEGRYSCADSSSEEEEALDLFFVHEAARRSRHYIAFENGMPYQGYQELKQLNRRVGGNA